jgi:multiple sugar transport system substrate-binding protein
MQPVQLEWWSVFDDGQNYREIFDAYSDIHSNVSVIFKRLRYEEYNEELLRAFAEGRGPDIISIHNTWIPEYQTLIQPMPESTSLVFIETRGTLKKEQVPVMRETPTLTVRQLRDQFVDVVVDDVVKPYQENQTGAAENRIWGLPSSVDSLALFYNKDLLNGAGIPEPPKTWKEFQDAVKKLTRIDASGNIVQSGAALGTANNVERATDLLSVIMMQNGTEMANSSTGAATFADVSRGSSSEPEAVAAVRFYTDFANPIKEVYTWNDNQPSSFDAFANGTTAFFFGYSYHTPLLQARNPKLNFDVAKLPQIGGSRVVNYASYWVHTVAKSSKHADEAWDLIQFATKKEQAEKYLATAERPTALRELINAQIENSDMSVFASQTLTAKSWYKGRDAGAAETALLDLIDNALSASKLIDELRITQNKVNQTL